MISTWQEVTLGSVLTKSDEWTEILPGLVYKQVTVRLWGKGAVLRGEIEGGAVSASRQRVVRAGQFILSRIDARNGALGLVPTELNGAIVTNDFPSFVVDHKRLMPAYLAWLSKTNDFVRLCQAASEGTTNRIRLQEDRFLAMPLLLPPLAEQQRIVARIDALASRIEEAKGLRAQAVAEVEAVMGAIIAGIQVNTPVSCLIDVLLDKPRNGWSVVCDNDPQGIAILTLSAVTGFVFRKNEFKTTSASTDPTAHYWLSPGDILITRSNTPELVGHAAIYQGEPNPCIYPDLMMRLQVNERKADRRFLWYWLRGPLVREFIRRKAKGTSPTMKKISQKIVMEIPFPAQLSIDRQRRLVTYLDDLQTKVDAVKRLQAETQAELNALLPAVLDRAFRGEL